MFTFYIFIPVKKSSDCSRLIPNLTPLHSNLSCPILYNPSRSYSNVHYLPIPHYPYDPLSSPALIYSPSHHSPLITSPSITPPSINSPLLLLYFLTSLLNLSNTSPTFCPLLSYFPTSASHTTPTLPFRQSSHTTPTSLPLLPFLCSPTPQPYLPTS